MSRHPRQSCSGVDEGAECARLVRVEVLQPQDNPVPQTNVAARLAVQASSRAHRDRTVDHQTDLQELIAVSLERIATSRRLLDRSHTHDPFDRRRHGADWPNSMIRAEQDRTLERLSLLESVVVHANDAILITDADPMDRPGSRILYCNAAFTRMTGYAEDEVRGRNPRLLQGPGTDRATLDRLRHHVRSWQPLVVELLNYRRDGSSFWVELSIVPVAAEPGTYTHWIALQRDVSDRRAAADAAILQRTAELERQALEADIESRKLVESRLFRAAFHDDMTGLYNRAFFFGHLTSLLAQVSGEEAAEEAGSDASPGGPRWALLFLDLDRFKFINDTLGHGVGDQLLVEVARRLAGCIREDDVLARMGGDEFAVLIDVGGRVENAVALGERILIAFQDPFQLGDHTVVATCSIGIAPVTSQYRTPEAPLRDADIAMYRSKRSSGHHPALFTSQIDAGAVLALSLQSSLLPGLERGEFRLLYQPIFTAEAAYPVSFEALVRWQHPERGLISPAAFVSLAEDCGLARSVGRWVLGEALRQARDWTDRHPEAEVRLNVNVSPHELLDERYAAEVIEALATAAMPGWTLELEITETVFQARSPQVLHTLRQLREAGIRLALDDFGTGYSSLGSIDSYPIDTLKIDRSFVTGMLVRPRTRALVQTIISLAKALDLDTVAEGVETEAEYQALIAMGCHHFQGYHLSRPIDFADAMRIGGVPS